MYAIHTIGSIGDASPLDAWKNALPGLGLDPSWVPGAVVNPDGTVTPPPGYNGPPLIPVLPPVKRPPDAPMPIWKQPVVMGAAAVGALVLVLALTRLR